MNTRTIWATLDPFVERGEMMGRVVANQGWLGGLLACDPYDEYHFYLSDLSQAVALRQWLEQEHGQVADRVRYLTRNHLLPALTSTPFHCFHLSDCVLSPAHLAAARNRYAKDIFPITSVTHSLSYTRYSSSFLAHLWPGTTQRDVVVATSATGKKVMQSYYEELQLGYNLNPAVHRAPGVEVIPLGLDTTQLQLPQGTNRDKAREQARAALQLDRSACVVLCFARISHHSKMDLLPVLRAFQRMKAQGVEDVVLLVAGFVRKGDTYPDVLQRLAHGAGISLRLVANPDEDTKKLIYTAADIFLSPVDNVQETFGLTILEAGAMELPVVASDYDGYKDLVQDGETGFLVPTLAPDDSADLDVMAPLWFDTKIHLELAQRTVVEVGPMADALLKLVRSPQLRASMGQTARARICGRYSWQQIASEYVELWETLWTRPGLVCEEARCDTHPMHTSFGTVFGSYPTASFADDMLVVQTRVGRAVYRGQEVVPVYTEMEHVVDNERAKKLVFAARKPIAWAALVERTAEMLDVDVTTARALAAWGLKHDLLERTQDGDA